MNFITKNQPSEDKLRGGYYTPKPLAEFIAEWVATSGSKILEPSAGDGNILAALNNHSCEPTAVELIPAEARKAEERTGVKVEVADFFAWFTAEKNGSFDGVAGNPPYIRFGNWDESSRSKALSLMTRLGLKPTRLTNAWVPFVVGAISACKVGGRVGLVLPAELMQVGYAAELRQFLIDNCKTLDIVTFKSLIFPGILQEVILLLAVKGEGPAEIRVADVQGTSSLQSLEFDTSYVKAPLHAKEKWTKYFLKPSEVSLLRSLRTDARLHVLSHFAKVNVGVVTGRNSFFVMTQAEALDRGISDITIPVVTRSAQLEGIRFGEEDLKFAAGRTRLLDARDVEVGSHLGLEQYIVAGEEAQVHTGFKCRIRDQWWVVPSIWEADAFMLRQVHTHPRIVANLTQATSTDTVHRMKMLGGTDSNKLAVAVFNSFSFALTETAGRSYGGGILEIEPGEAKDLPVPDPELVDNEIIDAVDLFVRRKDYESALDLVDRKILVGKLGFSARDISLARNAWATLRDRRLNRGKMG